MSAELIPYITETRPDTGLTNGKIGIWCFLASEVMLFGAFFASYIVLRTSATEWPHGFEIPLNIPLATVNTVVLITLVGHDGHGVGVARCETTSASTGSSSA